MWPLEAPSWPACLLLSCKYVKVEIAFIDYLFSFKNARNGHNGQPCGLKGAFVTQQSVASDYEREVLHFYANITNSDSTTVIREIVSRNPNISWQWSFFKMYLVELKEGKGKGSYDFYKSKITKTFHLTDPLLTILGPPGVTQVSAGLCEVVTGQQQHYYNSTTAAARAARQQRCCCGIKSYKDNFHPGQLVSSGPGSNIMVGG